MKSINKMLVPVDFSSQSAPVIRYALSVASQPGSTLTVLYVNELTSLPFGSSSYPFGVVTFPELEKEINDWAQSEFEKIAETLPAGQRNKVTFRLRSGKAADQIAKEANESGTDLIILAAHTHGVVEKFFLGSTMERLVRITQVPVIVMRDPVSVPHFPPSKILVTTDYSPASFLVFPLVKAVVESQPAAITILAVDSLEAGFLDAPDADVKNRWLTELAETGSTVQWIETRATDPVEGILQAIQDIGPELVAMTTHGRSGLSKVLLGSTTESIIRQIHLPVLVHHTR